MNKQDSQFTLDVLNDVGKNVRKEIGRYTSSHLGTGYSIEREINKELREIHRRVITLAGFIDLEMKNE